jgi:hypothetical protein
MHIDSFILPFSNLIPIIKIALYRSIKFPSGTDTPSLTTGKQKFKSKLKLTLKFNLRSVKVGGRRTERVEY